jgi:conserved domain protein
MGEFYITKVVAKGSGKTDSVIDLHPGLNIIRGRSNTGKTCIIKCIDFCFGSKAKPFDESLGYDIIAQNQSESKRQNVNSQIIKRCYTTSNL